MFSLGTDARGKRYQQIANTMFPPLNFHLNRQQNRLKRQRAERTFSHRPRSVLRPLRMLYPALLHIDRNENRPQKSLQRLVIFTPPRRSKNGEKWSKAGAARSAWSSCEAPKANGRMKSATGSSCTNSARRRGGRRFGPRGGPPVISQSLEYLHIIQAGPPGPRREGKLARMRSSDVHYSLA